MAQRLKFLNLLHTFDDRVIVKLAKKKTAIPMSMAASDTSRIVKSGSSAASTAHCSKG